MSKRVQSIKGETVDFDLFKIKEQISKNPKSSEVLMRENYIDVKRRRTSRKNVSQLLADQEKRKKVASDAVEAQNEEETVNAEKVEAVTTEEKVEKETPTKTKKRPVRKKPQEK